KDGRNYGTNASVNNDYVTLQQLNSGTSAVIAQTITNGVTTSAPSQDAVFDALALKANDNNVLHNTGNENKLGSLGIQNSVDMPVLGQRTGVLAYSPDLAAYGAVLGNMSNGDAYIDVTRFDGAEIGYNLLLK